MTKANTKHWDNLYKTDPAHTKKFRRAGGFSGTAMKPIWMIKRMTEEFGPVGKGWGIGKPDFQVVDLSEATGKILVYCWVEMWHTEKGNSFYGVGGDTVQDKFNSGKVVADDEAFKKAYTDAVNNAMKYLGVGGDVHMGQFDDSKYVAQMTDEFTPTHESLLKLEEFTDKVAIAKTSDEMATLIAEYANDITEAAEHDSAAVMKAKQSFAKKRQALAEHDAKEPTNEE